MTNYIARRLVEREQALASDWRSRSTSDGAIKTRARAKKLADGASAVKNGEAAPVPPDKREAAAGGFWVRAADIFSFLLMTLGSFALVGILCVGAWAAWSAWGRAFWAANFGSPPF
jgi:hypothetical protein